MREEELESPWEMPTPPLRPYQLPYHFDEPRKGVSVYILRLNRDYEVEHLQRSLFRAFKNHVLVSRMGSRLCISNCLMNTQKLPAWNFTADSSFIRRGGHLWEHQWAPSRTNSDWHENHSKELPKNYVLRKKHGIFGSGSEFASSSFIQVSALLLFIYFVFIASIRKYFLDRRAVTQVFVDSNKQRLPLSELTRIFEEQYVCCLKYVNALFFTLNATLVDLDMTWRSVYQSYWKCHKS